MGKRFDNNSNSTFSSPLHTEIFERSVSQRHFRQKERGFPRAVTTLHSFLKRSQICLGTRPRKHPGELREAISQVAFNQGRICKLKMMVRLCLKTHSAAVPKRPAHGRHNLRPRSMLGCLLDTETPHHSRGRPPPHRETCAYTHRPRGSAGERCLNASRHRLQTKVGALSSGHYG